MKYRINMNGIPVMIVQGLSLDVVSPRGILVWSGDRRQKPVAITLPTDFATIQDEDGKIVYPNGSWSMIIHSEPELVPKPRVIGPMEVYTDGDSTGV